MYRDFAMAACPIVVLLLRAGVRGVELVYKRYNLHYKMHRMETFKTIIYIVHPNILLYVASF